MFIELIIKTNNKEKLAEDAAKKLLVLALSKKSSEVIVKEEEAKEPELEIEEDKKEEEEEEKEKSPTNTQMVDKWTQTEAIDFQRARMKARMFSKPSINATRRIEAITNSITHSRIISTRSESEAKVLFNKKYSKKHL